MDNQAANMLRQKAFSFFCLISLFFYLIQDVRGHNEYTTKDSLINHLKNVQDENEKMQVLLQLSEIYLTINEDSAIFFANETIDLFEKTHNLSFYGDALNLKAKALLHKGKVHDALILAKKALDISKKLNDKYRIASSWSNMGGVYKTEGHYSQALLSYFKALQHSDSIQNRHTYANILHAIATIYSKQNNPTQALNYYNRAFLLNGEKGNSAVKANLLSDMGCAYYDLNEGELALDYHLKSIPLFLETNDYQGLAQSYACVAHSYLEKQAFSTALNYAKKGMETANKSTSETIKAHTHIRLAQIYSAINNNDLAVKELEEGISIAQNAHDKQQEQMGYFIFAEIYKKQRLFDKALLYTEKAQEISQEMQNNDKMQELGDLQSSYELETQQKLIQHNLNLLQESQTNGVLFKRFVAAVSLLSFILFIVLAVAFYQKNKSEKKLAEMNREISEQAAKLDATVKERTRALEISQANVLAIMNNTKDSIWSLDTELNMITLNKPLKDGIFGEMAVLIKPGTNIKKILPNDQYLFWKEKYERCLKGENFIFEFSFNKKTHESTYEVSLNPIRDENGEIVGASTFCREITSRKQNEIEKMRLIQTLTESNKDLEDFAYIVSHNLRAPVARMGGLMQIFNKNDSSDPINKFVFDNLAKGAKELDGITHDLNAIVAVRSHAQEERIQLSLSSIFEQVEKSLQHELDLVNAKVSMDFSAANELYAVKSYMYNIFHNLLANAIKYRQLEKSLEVKVWTERTGTCIYLYFQDNGLGIDLEKNRKKMFGLYNRFHQHIKGKGIGLHIVKAQVQVMNCKIDVKSEVNNGTCFEICFPGDMVV